MKNKGDKTMKKVLLTSAVALAAFGAVQAVSAENLVLKPGMVDPKTGKVVTVAGTAGTVNDAYNDAFVNGKLDVNNLPAYSRFGAFDIKKASITPAAEAKNSDKQHYVRVNVVDGKGNPIPGVAIDFEVPTSEGVKYVSVTTDATGSAIVTKETEVKVDVAGTKAKVELPASFPEGAVVKYRLVKSLATDGKDVAFRGEFKVSEDLYTNANIVVATRTDVTFQGQSAASQSTETPAKKAEWIQSGSRWWYKHADGSYTTNGWEKINGTWYYFDQAGWMATGWVKDNGTWYYLENSGAMKASQWFEVGGKWYYVNGSGALAVNTTVDGYTVNGNGEWVK